MKRKEKRCIKYPSIEQFRTVVSNINRHYNYTGLDENGDAIYDHSLPKPILKFKGTIKLHGTNSGVSYNAMDGLWAQSRENVITPTSDNAGFAFFVESNKEVFMSLIQAVADREGINLGYNNITIYGEWVGKSIQKGVGIANLEKSMFIFGVKVSPFQVEEDEPAPAAYLVDHSYLRSPEHKIYNIGDYENYEIEIDFNMPQLIQNQLSEITIAVETECPVSKAFGFPNTIGEGVVWSCDLNGVRYSFKVKGELHAGKSKVKTLNTVDDEKIRKVVEVADKVTPTWRLAQMLEQSCDLMNGGTLERSKLGDYIRLVINDIIKEEMDVLVEAGLEPKDVNKHISEIARRYFFDQELI